MGKSRAGKGNLQFGYVACKFQRERESGGWANNLGMLVSVDGRMYWRWFRLLGPKESRNFNGCLQIVGPRKW